MKPCRFEYIRADSVEQALTALTHNAPEARVLAGGQSLVPMMNFRLARPACLIDIGAVPSLSYIRRVNGSVAIGAGTSQSTIERSALVQRFCPLVTDAVRLIGNRTVRNRGTVGGSIAHADPSAELPAVLLALDGEVTVQSSSTGERTIPAEDLFITAFTTSLAPDELITEVRFPVRACRTGASFLELSRRHGDYAVVGVAVSLTLDGGEVLAHTRIALAGADNTPIRCPEAEAALTWNAPTDEVIREAARLSAEAAQPQDDSFATATYKRAMVRVLAERALWEASRQAKGMCYDA